MVTLHLFLTKSKKYKFLINLNEKPGIHIIEKIGIPLCKRVTMNLSMINLSLKIILVIPIIRG